MKYLVQLSRILVGALFIFSGWVKLNDPMGFGFKLEEYFSEGVLNMPFFSPWAVELAVIICISEILLGVFLLLGIWKRFTSWALLIMIIFFTFLTWYSWNYDKVTDCGCFGDAIPLETFESFVKDLILSGLILIIFFGRKFIQPIVSKKVALGFSGVVLLACFWITSHVLNHLPMVDFRAYKIGTDIEEGMKTAEELGLQGPVYQTMFTLKNANSGEVIQVDDKQYIDEGWWEKPEWELQNDLTESKLIEKGYEPPIHDYSQESDTGDITFWLLEQPKVVMVLAYELERADPEGLDAIGEWSWTMEGSDIVTVGWTSSVYETIEAAKHEHQIGLDFTVGDGTAIKTVIRSNPGIVALENGVIVGKWHWNDLPSREELEALFK
ncbi:BT_3928 family protein [Phaeocystidibacter luteus]|uniref:DoxX family protein n=1 Tax=Phaeocystidibacter luteus TaxID=911197 RepID=A0A6N6RIA5_9FLAO|nr:BT_3928 family protein [Phaeocystidibacter luteus]KAB2810027.1 DoxX family protein [Phaeocystidibacter luteus]